MPLTRDNYITVLQKMMNDYFDKRRKQLNKKKKKVKKVK